MITWTQITSWCCLLYTSDAADEEDSVDLGGRRIIKKIQFIFFIFRRNYPHPQKNLHLFRLS